MEAKDMNSLELINARFVQIQEEKARERKNRHIHLGIRLALASAVAISLALWFYLPVWVDSHSAVGAAGSAKRASVTEEFQDLLTPMEIEEWNNTRVQFGKIYIKLKTEIQITGGTKAYISLINPPYCAYDCKFYIEEKDTGEILYESGTVEPGNIVEYVSLNENAAYGETEVCVTLRFFRNGKDRAIREEKVDAVLVTEK